VFPATAADIFRSRHGRCRGGAGNSSATCCTTTVHLFFQVVMRLAPKVTMAAAEAALDAQTRQLDEQNGKRDPNRDKQDRVIRLVMAGGIIPTTPEMRASSFASWGLVLTLILSCHLRNLAGLMLARGSAPRREIRPFVSRGRQPASLDPPVADGSVRAGDDWRRRRTCFAYASSRGRS